MLRAWYEDSFDASHQCPAFGVDHKCARMHGHTYRVRLEIGGTLDMTKGIIRDFADIKAAWLPVKDRLDHRHLNDVLGNLPTSEIIACYIFGQVQLALPQLCKVEVRETEHCGATIEVPNGRGLGRGESPRERQKERKNEEDRRSV